MFAWNVIKFKEINIKKRTKLKTSATVEIRISWSQMALYSHSVIFAL
jgi:hypothetical protein